MSNFNFQPSTQPNAIQHELKPPAIGLIVVGGFNAVLAALILLSGLVRLVGNEPSAPITDEAERLGYVAGTLLGYAVGVMSHLLSPVVIAGGVAMLRGKSLGLARGAAILAMVPLTSCCCVVGIPIGIWALMILRKPEVGAYFRRQGGPDAGGAYG